MTTVTSKREAGSEGVTEKDMEVFRRVERDVLAGEGDLVWDDLAALTPDDGHFLDARVFEHDADFLEDKLQGAHERRHA